MNEQRTITNKTPDAAWHAWCLHKEAQTLQALALWLAYQHPEASEIAATRIEAELSKERQS